MPPQPDELTLAIARALEVDWQYAERVEAWDAERIAEVRSAGRKAGRLLGFKIATFQGQPDAENRVASACSAPLPLVPARSASRRAAREPTRTHHGCRRTPPGPRPSPTSEPSHAAHRRKPRGPRAAPTAAWPGQ